MREVILVVYALVQLLADYLGERVPETKILVIFYSQRGSAVLVETLGYFLANWGQ